MQKIHELTPIYDTRKSFYGKAHVIETQPQGKMLCLELKSYDTIVACIDNNIAVVYDTYSPTTLRHIKEFLKQNGFRADTKAQIEKDYMA